jgi:pimeloyl-ACP methyl ester carboxylesterase
VSEDTLRRTINDGRLRCNAVGIVMKFLSSLLIAVTLLLVSFVASAEDATPNEVFRAVQRIPTPDGIQKLEKVRIGGIDQWISIRGKHRDAPILLFLHGGPGFTSIPSSYLFMQGWDEYFTVVQWDQRGAGKTYASNDAEKLRSTMSVDRMVGDAEELVAYLRKTYGRQRIVLMGHSWGTALGVMLAQRHPDWFYAYVGVGQIVDVPRSEAMGYEAVLKAARADGNRQAVAELEAMAPFPDPKDPKRTLAALEKERHWMTHYDGVTWHDEDGHDGEVATFSPDYAASDLKARDAGLEFSLETLWAGVGKLGFTGQNRFGCPVVLFQGRHDLTTSATLVGEWFPTLQAPSKKLVWFDDSAHMVFEEEPGKVLVHLVQDVLPLTREGATK